MECVNAIILIVKKERMVSVDLEDAYLTILMHQHFPRFTVTATHFQFYFLPFDVCTAPTTFKNVLFTVITILRTQGVHNSYYVDNILILGK